MHAKLNLLCTYVEVQATLFRLFVPGFVLHLLSSWGWSAILFVPDPLPASTIHTHKGETLTRCMRGKPAHWGMTKTFKAFSVSQIFFFRGVFQPIQMSSTWKSIFFYFLRHVLFVFLWTLRLTVPPQNEVRACSSCQTACSIEILPPLMGSRAKTNFLKEKGNKRIRADNVCATSH